MSKGLGTRQREVLEQLQRFWNDGIEPSWSQLLDCFVIGTYHPERGYGNNYRGSGDHEFIDHHKACRCSACLHLIWGHKFKSYADYMIWLQSQPLPPVDPLSKRESYRRAVRTLIDREIAYVHDKGGLATLAPIDRREEPLADGEKPWRWQRTDRRRAWREAISANLTDEWQSPADLCLACWKQVDPGTVEKVMIGTVERTRGYKKFRTALNQLRKDGAVQLLQGGTAAEKLEGLRGADCRDLRRTAGVRRTTEGPPRNPYNCQD